MGERLRNETRVPLSALAAEPVGLRYAWMLKVANRNRQLVGFDPDLINVRFQVAVEGVERLFIPVPIEILKFEFKAVVE